MKVILIGWDLGIKIGGENHEIKIEDDTRVLNIRKQIIMGRERGSINRNWKVKIPSLKGTILFNDGIKSVKKSYFFAILIISLIRFIWFTLLILES